jgi:hypothetical protein
MVVLHETIANPQTLKHPLVIAFQKEAALVAEYAGLKDEYFRQ